MTKIVMCVFVCCLYLHGVAQNRAIVKLSKTQIQSLKSVKSGDKTQVTFNDPNVDNLMKNIKIVSFRQSFPLAEYFDHPARERVLQYYTLEGNFDVDSLIEELTKKKVFESIVKDEAPVPLYDPNDYALADPTEGQWGLNFVKAKQAWDITKGSSTIKVAVIDFGFQSTHEDLIDQIVYQDASMPVDEHGNTVSGCIAARTDNNKGLSSIGFNSKLMLYYINTNAYNTILAASLAGAKVINCSFKTAGCSYQQVEQDVINMAVANGSVIVAAAGNGLTFGSCGSDGMAYHYPASYDNVISVAGTYKDSYFYNGAHYTFNDKVDLTAPSFRVASTGLNNTYILKNGTSFGTPLTSGTVALMFAAKNCLTPAEIEYILKKTADKSINNTTLHPENAPYVNLSGAGRLDAFAAVQFAQTWPASVANFAKIQGTETICTNSTFTISDVPLGTPITWSSNTTGVSINATTGVATRVNNFLGQAIIKATIGSSCGTSFITKTVRVGGPPAVEGIDISNEEDPLNLCPNTRYIVEAYHQVYPEYEWLLPTGWTSVEGGSQNPFVTTQPIMRTDSKALNGGSFKYIRVRGRDGCSFGDPFFLPVDTQCGAGLLALYPNPAQNELTINTSSINPEATDVTVTIYDCNQQRRKIETFKEQIKTVSISDLENGIYHIYIQSRNATLERKVIINRN